MASFELAGGMECQAAAEAGRLIRGLGSAGPIRRLGSAGPLCRRPSGPGRIGLPSARSHGRAGPFAAVVLVVLREAAEVIDLAGLGELARIDEIVGVLVGIWLSEVPGEVVLRLAAVLVTVRS